MKAAWLLLIALALPGMAGAQTKASPRHVSDKTLDTIVAAVAKGDVPILAKLYKQSSNPVTHVLAAMALERIHFNLAAATKDARLCEHALMTSQPRIAYFCAEFANGDIRLGKGETAADRDERAMAQRFAGHLSNRNLRSIQRYLAYRRKTPPLQVHEPAGTFTIPVDTTLASHMPAIDVTANGTTLALIVDTGSNYVTVDAKWAHKLGVRMTGRTRRARGFSGHEIHVRSGILDKLTFAGVTMQHVPVTIVPGTQRLIGIAVLRHLGSWRLAEDKITVYGGSTARPACRQPMLIGSDIWGQHIKLLTAFPIDAKLRTVLIDSGTSAFMAATKGALKHLQIRHTARSRMQGIAPHTQHVRTNRATAKVLIAHQPFTVTFPVFTDARNPWDYVIGSGALKYMDFYFDFDHHHTCLLVHHDTH